MNKNDMSGKLADVKKMRIMAGLLILVAMIGSIWIMAFSFLYPSFANGQIAMCWMIFLCLLLPFCWPVSLICGFLSIFLTANNVLVLSSTIVMIIVLMVMRAVYLPNPQTYEHLVFGIQVEKIKSVLVLILASFFYLVNAGSEYILVYVTGAIYQVLMIINFSVFYFFENKLNQMKYREIFDTDWKNPYGKK